MTTARLFVVVSGLPGSGKTTIGRRLAEALGLPLIDKDEILDALFEQRGVGDQEWRRALSRESDESMRSRAMSSRGAVLVSFWRVTGMPADVGTPTEWLFALPAPVVHVRCQCPARVAAERFVARRRHPGHLDATRTLDDVLSGMEAEIRFGPLHIEPSIEVDTTVDVDIDGVVERLRQL